MNKIKKMLNRDEPADEIIDNLYTFLSERLHEMGIKEWPLVKKYSLPTPVHAVVNVVWGERSFVVTDLNTLFQGGELGEVIDAWEEIGATQTSKTLRLQKQIWDFLAERWDPEETDRYKDALDQLRTQSLQGLMIFYDDPYEEILLKYAREHADELEI